MPRLLIDISAEYSDKFLVNYDVCGLGNALLDYQVQVPFEFLNELQVIKSSMTLVDTAFQRKAIQAIYDRYHLGLKKCSGGSAANTLAGLANFGGRGFFFGKVGADNQGRHYRDDLEKCGIKTRLVEESNDHTGTCLALITPDAERTMLTHLGVATQLSARDIDAGPIEDAAVLYIEGYLWDSRSAREASLKAMEIAKAKGRKVAFTFSDSFCVERHFEDFLNLAKNKIDILFCNELEAKRATNSKETGEAFQILKSWCPTVAVTLGPRGALLSDREKRIEEEVSTWDVQLIDKLGAGDLFAAGLLFGWVNQRPLREAGFMGCYAATRIIQKMGARLEADLSREIETMSRGPLPEEDVSRLQAQA